MAKKLSSSIWRNRFVLPGVSLSSGVSDPLRSNFTDLEISGNFIAIFPGVSGADRIILVSHSVAHGMGLVERMVFPSSSDADRFDCVFSGLLGGKIIFAKLCGAKRELAFCRRS